MEMGPSIARILGPLLLGRYRPPKKWETVRLLATKYEKVETLRPAPLGVSPGFDALVGFTWLGSQKRPADNPLAVIGSHCTCIQG